ncbi:magnesium chelatase [Novosphingobium marinum]|uniref:Magnesium chelatase accessory protein n=1 Tax=Novosphingobium marinum TaxID=1514948 RepID=A0A7Y9XZW8_9SPHN|nr:alpha/beta fold hydrolase BchO [Novosphingobium marinum]NYH96405.1 magnesium chelatase accessory protein [Novosphingobium marinum]GGC34932.1 magnesium chelatase [Novosphingobium marinum]
MSAPLAWDIEGRIWPHREATRFVDAAGVRWLIQETGNGPPLLLLHGTGASAHSWRGVMPALADRFAVIAPDLPGHGFTRGRPSGGLTLMGMAKAISDLLAALDRKPVLIAGHSAGTAIALQMAHEKLTEAPIVGFNSAIMPFEGLAARIFPTMAKMLFVNPFVPGIFAHMARVPGETARFLKKATNSRIDTQGLRCYEALFGNSRHCGGALEMMARWDLASLERALPGIGNRVLLVHSRGDSAVPLSSVEQAAKLLPDCRLEVLPKLGHLAHEEEPATAARLINEFVQLPAREAPSEEPV